ncbi:MAG: acyltransferase [Sphingomonadales bacterium]|nr:acyltransferase [Sphingomonadales bacterium]
MTGAAMAQDPIPPAVSAGDTSIATAPRPVSKERYRPELDGIRAICIIFTVLNHIPIHLPWINGEAGVDIFFPLSGWLITSLIIREFQETTQFNLKSFYIRRAFRILPLYYFMVSVYIFLVTFGFKKNGIEELKFALPFMTTLNMELRPPQAGSLFGHAWTLGIEEKFYIVWPMLLAIGWRNPWRMAAGVILLFLTISLIFDASGFLVRSYGGLGCGALLSVLSFRLPALRALLARSAVQMAFLGLVIAAYGWSIVVRGNVFADLPVSVSAAFLISSLWFNHQTVIGRWLTVWPLPWLGRLTYALYLIQSLCVRLVMTIFKALHIPQMVLPIFVAAYALAILFAWVMHVALEKPVIRFGRRYAN